MGQNPDKNKYPFLTHPMLALKMPGSAPTYN
jgi:hypothetical protein